METAFSIFIIPLKKKPIAQIATQIEGKKMEYESKRDREKLPSMPLKTQSKYYAFER